MSRFLRWWIVHSVLALIFYAIMRGTGTWSQATTSTSETLMTLGILITPVGAGIMWAALRFWWWLFFDLFLGMLKIPARPKYPSFGGKKISMNDGALGSQIGGSEYRIDNDGWVYEAGMAGARVGRVDEEGLVRTETDEVVGRIDPDGKFREHQEGFMAGVFESQEGTGEELGEVK